MIEHLQNHALGLVHVLFALAAIVVGTAIIFSRKGTRKHRWMGRCYVATMFGLNGTALLIYELFGRFGPFHWLALASLASVIAGYIPARRKAPGWKIRHAHYIVGSYVGLLAAAAAEVASRVPGWTFGPSVVISSVVIVVIGIFMMSKMIPRILGGSPAGQ